MPKNIESKFLSIKGQICTLTYKKPLNVVRNCNKVIEKQTTIQCRAGVNYDNISQVQEKRENGTYPIRNQGLPWGQWKTFPYIIEHKGKEYYRFSFLPDGNPTETIYFQDGEQVNKSEIWDKLQSIEKKTTVTEIFNINKDYILDIK